VKQTQYYEDQGVTVLFRQLKLHFLATLGFLAMET